MPKVEGVYQDGRGGWYFKATVGRDPLTGKRQQVTKRGFRTAGDALRARREVVARSEERGGPLAPASLTVNQLLDEYLDSIDADAKLGVKTRYDYRRCADAYVRPHLGPRRVREITSPVITTWQRSLAEGGSSKGAPLGPNTVRLARAPLAGAFKMAVSQGLVAIDPVAASKRPTKQKSVPHHWTPEQARSFLDLHQHSREWPAWAFLLGCGLRIGGWWRFAGRTSTSSGSEPSSPSSRRPSATPSSRRTARARPPPVPSTSTPALSPYWRARRLNRMRTERRHLGISRATSSSLGARAARTTRRPSHRPSADSQNGPGFLA